MAVTTKRKAGVKKETVTVRRERLRLRDWMLFWILVLANVALVCAIFGDIDVNTLKPVSVVNEEQQSAEQQLVDELKAQLKDLGDKVAAVENVNVNEGLEKHLVSLGYSFPECPVSVNLSSSTQDIIYLDTVEQNLSISLPYSFSWGSDKYLVNPIDRSRGVAGEVYFGPGSEHQCTLVRDSTLLIDNFERTLRQRRSEIASQLGMEFSNIRERMISGIPVLSYEVLADGGRFYREWMAFGRTNNYTLRSAGWLTDAEAIKIIQSLRVTK
jgi:hypothetical protein